MSKSENINDDDDDDDYEFYDRNCVSVRFINETTKYNITYGYRKITCLLRSGVSARSHISRARSKGPSDNI